MGPPIDRILKVKTTTRKKKYIKKQKLIVVPPSMEGAFQVVTVNKRRKNKYNPASEEHGSNGSDGP